MANQDSLANNCFLRALRRQPTEYTPVWLMRQAGRYLPEYCATRANAGSFMALAKNPELACEVTLQPIDRYGLDAAILFSDILTIPDAMGLGLSFVPGQGPVFAHPEAAGVEDGIGRRGHGFTWNRAGVGEVIPDAEARRGELATLGAKPIGHGVVERNEGVGVGEAGDFLRHGQFLAAERAEVVNERNHSRPSPMRHMADECKIFLERILKEKDIAPADAEAHGADAGQRAEEAVRLVVRARLGKAEVDESLFGPNPFHVCFRLAPGAAHIFVVAR